LAEQAQNSVSPAAALNLWAEAHAVAGQSDDARREAARTIEISDERGGVARSARGRFALGLVELGCGRPTEAAAVYRDVPLEQWRTWSYCAGGRASIDAVEAFVAVGEVELAREITATMPADAHERPVAEAILVSASGDLKAAIELVRSAPPS